MNRKQLKTNRLAISTLVIALIIIIVVGAIAAVVVATIFFGWGIPVGGSGNLVTEEKDFTDFMIVEAGWDFEVEITQSDSYSVDITADDNLFDYLEISKTGNTLTIGMKRSVIGTLEARITMPDLYELKLSGGSHGTLQEFTSSHEFSVDLSGGSHLSGDFTTSEDAQFTLSGGSHLTGLAGAANDLTISGSGGSHLDLSDFPAHDITVNLDGGSHATVNLDGRLDGDVSGGSHLKYTGTPTTIDVNASWGSIVGPQ